MDYTSNWRGARRYQFDEEARRKRAALRAPHAPPPIGPWNAADGVAPLLSSIEQEKSETAVDEATPSKKAQRPFALSILGVFTFVFLIVFLA